MHCGLIDGERCCAAGADPTVGGSRDPQGDNLILEVAGSELQRLVDSVVFQLPILLLEFHAIRIEGDGLDHAAYSVTPTADAGLPIHQVGVHGDAVKLGVHVALVGTFRTL